MEGGTHGEIDTLGRESASEVSTGAAEIEVCGSEENPRPFDCAQGRLCRKERDKDGAPGRRYQHVPLTHHGAVATIRTRSHSVHRTSGEIMKYLLALLLSSATICLLPCLGLAQSGAVIPQGGAGHAAQASCIILKRMGPADQITSHMYSFGIRGKQFQYVEGKLPEGAPFHGRMTDHDVRNLQGRGAEVIVLDSHYTTEDLKQARNDCRGETGKTPNQSDPRAAPPQHPDGTDKSADAAAPRALQTQPLAVTGATKLSVNSNPPGADIELDGAFVGNTPSTIDIASGEHSVVVSKASYKNWERKLKANGGNVNLNVDLEAQPK